MKDLIFKKGMKAYQENKYTEALKYFKQMQGEENSAVDYYLGLTETRLGQYNEAVKHFKKLIKQKINYELSIQVRKILGYIYTKLGDFGLAKEIFMKVTELNFNDSTAYSALGYIFYKMGDPETSIKFLKKSIEIDEKNATAHNSLGFVYADTEMRLNEAIKECEIALKLLPGYPTYLDSLGWAYYKKGDFKKAKNYLSMAMELMPESEEIRKHYKDVVIKEVAAKREKID